MKKFIKYLLIILLLTILWEFTDSIRTILFWTDNIWTSNILTLIAIYHFYIKDNV